MILIGNIWAGLGGGSGSMITLTTDGTSGPATLIGNVLNIPVYGSGGGAVVGADNGTHLGGVGSNVVYLGGTLLQNTTILGANNQYNIFGNDASGLSEARFLISGTTQTLNSFNGSGSVLGLNIDSLNDGITVTDQINTDGLIGAADYSSNNPLIPQVKINPLQYIQRSAVEYHLVQPQFSSSVFTGGASPYIQDIAESIYTPPNKQFLRISVQFFVYTVISPPGSIYISVVYTDVLGNPQDQQIGVAQTVNNVAQLIAPVCILCNGGSGETVFIRLHGGGVGSAVRCAWAIEYIADFS